MDAQIEEILSSLHSRHINGIFAENSEEACRKILDLIPKDATVGIGDSATIIQLGILKTLNERGTRILNPFELMKSQINLNDARQRLQRTMKEATTSEVFLTGTNAITLDGRLISVDAAGNRVAGMFWGHPISIIAVGKNKIVRDLEEAFQRVRNIIAPHHIRIRSVELGGRKFKTPCTETGECSDCRAAERACNIFTIIEGRPFFTNINVVVINEDLGLGWDPSWPQDRIMRILENYKKFVWIPI